MTVMIEEETNALIIERADAIPTVDAAAPVAVAAKNDILPLVHLAAKAQSHLHRGTARDTDQYRDMHPLRGGGATAPQPPHPLTRDKSWLILLRMKGINANL